MIRDLKIDQIKAAMAKVRGESTGPETEFSLFPEDFVSDYGFHYPEVYTQSLEGAVKATQAIIDKHFGGNAYRFRSAFIRYLTDFLNYSDATAATTNYTDLEKFIQYLITYAFDGKNEEYFKALQDFIASKS